MLDLRIVNGVVIDGTGAAGRPADLGVKDGRIVALGALDEQSARTIDAEGRVVAPGFVDVHTHLDAQLFWDPTASPSPLHGVTTAFAGNCGFTIAPIGPDSAEYLMAMLSRVEGMPLASLRTGVPWDWSTTGEYLDRLDGRMALNAGFMVGHSAIRRLVMGPAANERTATPAEISAMTELLRAGLAAGGMGFSTTTSDTHNDADGRPVPSRFAGRDEFLALARVCGEYPGTSLELLPRGTDVGPFADEVAELMIEMSVVAGRPLNWNVIQPSAAGLGSCLAKLAVGDAAAARGAKVVGLTMPIDMKARFSFLAGFVLDGFDGWAQVMALPAAEKLACFRDPDQRRDLFDGAARTANLRHLAKWSDHVIVETFTDRTAPFKGRLVGEIASEQGKEPFDALVDIAVTDDLRTTFARNTRPPSAADWDARLQICRDHRALVGASDAGAHLDMIAAFRYSTGLLQEAVRERNLLPIEEAIHFLTGAPARLYGLQGRGELRVGGRADILVLDPDTVGSAPVETRFDLPGGAGRLYADAVGIGHVFVNGVEVAADGAYTGELPGRVLRAGTDTHTPTMAL